MAVRFAGSQHGSFLLVLIDHIKLARLFAIQHVAFAARIDAGSIVKKG